MFTLNTEFATEGSSLGGGLIDTSGAYIGKIIEAKFGRGNNGAEYLELDFERSDGAKASFIKLYTKKNDGSEGFGIKQIHALMAVLKLRQMNDVKQLQQPIGLLLQREDYSKQDGSEGFQMKLIAPFDAQTKQTAEEILTQKQAATIDKIVESIVDKKVKKTAQNQQSNNMDYSAAYGQQMYQQPPLQQQQQQQQNQSFNDFNDDVPF